MTIDDFTFPILMFVKDGSISSSNSSDDLSTAYAGHINEKNYRNLFIVDSSGMGYTVDDIVILDKANIFQRIVGCFVLRRVKISFNIKETRLVPFEELQILLKKRFKSLLFGGDPEYNAILRNGINDASSTEEIIRLVSKWELREL